MRGTGHIRETAPHTPFARLSAKLGAPASSANLMAFTTKVFDQGNSGSCEGNATAGAIYCALAAAGSPIPWTPSQDGIYRLGRAIDRVPDEHGNLSPLTDTGAMTSQVIRGIAEWGIRPMGALASDGRYSDVELATVNDEPSLTEIEADAHHVIIGAYAITSWGKQKSDDVAACVSAGVPVVLAIAGGSQAFQAYSGGVLGTLNAPLDHAVFVVGYTTNADGSRVYTVRNSWGQSFGESGNVRISEDCLYQCGDLVAMKARLA